MIARRNLSQLAAHVVEWIENQGIVVAPGSRIDRMRAMLVPPDGAPAPFISPSDKGFELALEAERDLQMLGFTFEQLANLTLASDFQTHLRRLLKDAALPQDDSENTIGRDIQCELYVAAICMKAGTSPSFAEPDIRCIVDGLTFGVAIKRVKSLGTFEDRLRKAVKQIRRVNLPGIVVADISVMLNPTNERLIQPVSDGVYRAAADAMMRKFVDDQHERLLEWFRGSLARGLILIDHHVRQHPVDGWELDSMTFGVNLSPSNQRRSREFECFWRAFQKGLPIQTNFGWSSGWPRPASSRRG